MSRELTRHKTNECNKQIEVVARKPGAGGAATCYDIFGPRKACGQAGMVPSFGLNMKFQDGPVADGVNGLTNEVLLAIVEDRLVGFQSGKFANEHNGEALECIRSAQQALEARTAERIDRGVEGTHTV